MHLSPGPLLPVEIIQELARCVLHIDIAAAFDPYAAPVDDCILRPPSSHTPFVNLKSKSEPKCIQDGVHPIYPVCWDERDVGPINALVVEQAHGARHCVERPTARELLMNARKLILVSRTWRDAICKDSQIWPRACDGKFLSHGEVQRTIFPVRIVHNDTSTSYLALDPICSCAFRTLPDEWTESFTHLRITLPRLRCTPRDYIGYGPATFIEHVSYSLNLTHLEVRCAFPTSRIHTDDPMILPNLEVSRLINCEYLICGPKLRVLYFIALFAEILPLSHLLEGLSECPVLEVFHLHTVDFKKFGDDPRRETPPPPAISLQHLRHLYLSLAPDAHAKVLFMLDLPPNVEVHLEMVHGRSACRYVRLGLRELVPVLFMPERSRQVFQTTNPLGKTLDSLSGQPMNDWQRYQVIGLDVGLDRSREGNSAIFQYSPEFIRVILAGDVQGALAGMSGSSHDDTTLASLAAAANQLPRRSLSIRQHATYTPSRRGKPNSTPGFDAISKEISCIVEALQWHGVLQPGRTLVLGAGSYVPKSPLEWHHWLMPLHPSTLVIPCASVHSGRESTARGVPELGALALYLRNGIQEEKYFDRSLRSVSVSPTCLGDCVNQELARLAFLSDPGAEILAKRHAIGVDWGLYED